MAGFGYGLGVVVCGGVSKCERIGTFFRAPVEGPPTEGPAVFRGQIPMWGMVLSVNVFFRFRSQWVFTPIWHSEAVVDGG